jgi:hypothetical protein
MSAAASSSLPPISPTMMTPSVWVRWKQLEAVDEVHAAHRIAADTDAGTLAEAVVGGLEDGFVGQRAGARDDADRCPACG